MPQRAPPGRVAAYHRSSIHFLFIVRLLLYLSIFLFLILYFIYSGLGAPLLRSLSYGVSAMVGGLSRRIRPMP